MLTATQIKVLLREHGIYLKKSLGQTFLIDKNAKDKIMRLIDIRNDDSVIEIGPGLGALTEDLAKMSKYVYAVEKDRKLCILLNGLFSKYSNLEIVHCDFLKFDIGGIPSAKLKAVSALPYYLTTSIIQRLLQHRDKIGDIYIVVQREVAHRLAALPGDDDYGSLSIFVQFYAEVSMLMKLKREVFFPRPEVDSAMVRLKVLPEPRAHVKNKDLFFKAVRASFSQRRKTVLSALSHKKALGLDKAALNDILERAGIDKRIRPESLSIDDFARIADGIIDFLP